MTDENTTEEKIYEMLIQLLPGQLDHLITLLKLDREYLGKSVAATLAVEICTLAKQKNGPAWVSVVADALNKVMSLTRSYFEEKLGHIKDFLVEPPEPVDPSPQHKGTVIELRDALKKREKLEEPQLIKVKGTLFPAALLTAGWWERVRSEGLVDIKWRNTLQRWLFEGFDAWAPSWEISWDFEGLGQRAKPYYVAQLTAGDEADSLAVILPPRLAREWRDKFRRTWGGLEVEVTGILGHRAQAQKELAAGEVLPGQASEYCIWLKDDEAKHDIQEFEKDTVLYSGYIWKCLIPRRWMEEGDLVGLSQVYIAWEHTNFAARDAVRYNMAALRHKESLIHTKHRKDGGLILLQKSHWLVPGEPVWPIEDFYNLLARKKVKVPAGLLNKNGSSPKT